MRDALRPVFLCCFLHYAVDLVQRSPYLLLFSCEQLVLHEVGHAVYHKDRGRDVLAQLGRARHRTRAFLCCKLGRISTGHHAFVATVITAQFGTVLVVIELIERHCSGCHLQYERGCLRAAVHVVRHHVSTFLKLEVVIFPPRKKSMHAISVGLDRPNHAAALIQFEYDFAKDGQKM